MTRAFPRGDDGQSAPPTRVLFFGGNGHSAARLDLAQRVLAALPEGWVREVSRVASAASL